MLKFGLKYQIQPVNQALVKLCFKPFHQSLWVLD